MAGESVEVFFSYAHRDEGLRNELADHLAILQRQGVIAGWHDRQITAGREWAKEIDAHLNQADIILLLVSSSFLASDFCWSVEVKRAIERHEAKECLVIPVILRPVDWDTAHFGKLQACPKDAKAVTTWTNQDEAFRDIAQSIRAAAATLQQARQAKVEQGEAAIALAQRDYCQQLIKWFDDVKFAGVAVEGQDVERAEQLAQIFVMPDVVEEGRRSPFEDIDRWEAAAADRQTQLLQEQRLRSQADRSGRKLSARQLLQQGHKKAVLLGAPGSGKTTLMSYLAVTLAEAAIAKALQPHAIALPPPTEALPPPTIALSSNTIALSSDTEAMQPSTIALQSSAIALQSNTEALLPILIRIRDWAVHPEMPLIDYVRQFAEKTMAVKPLPAGFFEHWLDRGRAVILLDGLDEVAEAAKRYRMVQCIENFLGQHQQNRAIVTSRPAGYRRDFFRTEEFPHYELQQFDDRQIDEFVDRWYDSRIEDKAEAQRRKESLRKALSDSDRIKLLARNPLLLTIIALIHRYQAVLPKQRHKLYDKAVDTLLTSWDANKELSDRTALKYLDSDDLRRLMESLAYWIHTQGNTGDQEGGTLIDRDELAQQLTKLIKAQKSIERYQAEEEAKRFIAFIRDRTGLLNEQGQDCYAFVHKTFQEYLCAQEIQYREENQDFEDAEDYQPFVLNHIRQHLHDSHWREVLLLLVAQQKPKKAAKAIDTILNHGSPYEQWLHRDLLFAGKCLAENPKGLKGADAELTANVLTAIIELEVSNSRQVSETVRYRLLQTLCSLNETEFEAETLQQLKTEAASIDAERLRQYRAALGEGEAVIRELLVQLTNDDADVRSRAAIALGELGNASEAVVQALLSQLTDDNTGVRYRTAIALGELGNASEAVVQALLSRLTDDDVDVRSRAAVALGELGNASEAVVQALLSRLTNDDADVRSRATVALGKLGNASEAVVQALLSQLTDDDADVRYRAAIALGEPGNASEAVVQALLSQLTDDNVFVRSRAAIALGKLGNASEAVVQALLSQLTDDDADVRSSAAIALGKLGNASEAVVQALLSRLTDDNALVRYSAAIALGELGNASGAVVQALLSQLTDDGWYVRYSAAEALGKLSNASEAVVQALLARLTDDNVFVRSRAVIALSELGKTSNQVASVLIAWIEQNQDSEYLGHAIDALWAIVEG